jgi:hypothetical protein
MLIVRLPYAREGVITITQLRNLPSRTRLTSIPSFGKNRRNFSLVTVTLREALINLGLIACLFLSVGELLYLGTTALVAAPL